MAQDNTENPDLSIIWIDPDDFPLVRGSAQTPHCPNVGTWAGAPSLFQSSYPCFLVGDPESYACCPLMSSVDTEGLLSKGMREEKGYNV